jgi:FixJ family two-component response regulator
VEEVDAIVFVVDDNPSFRRSTERLIRLAGYKVQAFDSAQEFLAAKRPDGPSCLVLDVRMPGLSGLDLQRELAKAGIAIPIIFITGHGDIPMSVQAMKAGAVEFFTKPFNDRRFLSAIGEALERDRAALHEQARLAEVRACYRSLTPREHEVMGHVVSGLLNKQIAARLHTVEKTVKFHRAHVMVKMRARSLAELVAMAADLGVLRTRTTGPKSS